MSTPRRIKIIWGASKVIRGRWYLGLFGLYDRHEGLREDGIAISLRGLLVWCGSLLLAGWLAVTSLAFWFWQRNPHNLLTYGDAFLYPLRRAEIAEKKGRAYLAQGTELARAGRWFDAEKFLRVGLARYPRDLNARLLLAQFYQAVNQHSLAFRTLREGLGADYPGRAYLTAFFRLTSLAEDWSALAETSERYLAVATERQLAIEQRWLRERRHEALQAAGRHAEALRLAEAELPGPMRDERRILALLGLGRINDARAILTAWRAQPETDLRHLSRLEARVAREAGQLDDLERALTELRRLAPDEPAAFVYGIVQRALASRTTAAEAALTDYLFRFGGFPGNLVLVAAPLAEIGQLALLEQVVAAARERGHPLEPLLAHLIDSQLAHGRWTDAAASIAALPPPADASQFTGRIWRNWLNALVDAALDSGEPAQQALLDLFRGPPWAMGMYRRTLDALRRAGRIATAVEIVGYGLKTYPNNPWLQAQATELGAQLEAQRAREEQARATTAAAPAPPPPPATEGTDALLAQLQASQRAGDATALLRAARLLLTGDRARAESAVALAREWARSGDTVSTDLLLREVLRRHEGFPPARRLQQELAPPAPGEK